MAVPGQTVQRTGSQWLVHDESLFRWLGVRAEDHGDVGREAHHGPEMSLMEDVVKVLDALGWRQN